MYYFDYASTTKPSPKILDLYLKLSNDIFFHPDDTNKSGKLMNEAKNIILSSLQLNNTYDVVFTSGGTEANNLAIIGYAQNFTSKKHYITSSYEHSSVYSSFKYLEKQGHEVTYLKVNSDGLVDLDQLKASLQPNTVLVSIMAVNNEIGAVNNSLEIRNIINNFDSKIIYMSDVVQAVSKVEYDYSQLDVMTISGHKLYAPKGIGAVIYKKEVTLKNTIFGGAQQDGIRPGTICPVASVTLAYALKLEMACLKQTISHTTKLVNTFVEFIETNPKANLNVTPMGPVVSVNFTTKALSESLITVLNNMDIYASTRSACSKKLNVRSRTLQSIGLTNDQIDKSMRFSFSHNTTVEELNYLIQKLEHVLEIY